MLDLLPRRKAARAAKDPLQGCKKAKDVNHELDREVAPKIHTLEVDEIFQGQENVILGPLTSAPHMLSGSSIPPTVPKLSLAAFLRPIAKLCANIRVVITDLFRPYAEVVKVLFAKVGTSFATCTRAA